MDRESLKPIQGANRPLRQRLGITSEFTLAFLPTLTVLGVLLFFEVLGRQKLLFSSLAASAFLIYLDPKHGTNAIRTLVIAHMTAATLGLITYLILGPTYASMGTAMVATIISMILLDTVHPPAVSTSLSFALRAENETNWILFALATAITVVLVFIERWSLWLLAHLEGGDTQ